MKAKPIDYVKRTEPVTPIMVRVTHDMKLEIDKMTDKLDTSMNRFIIAAINFYIEEINKGK